MSRQRRTIAVFLSLAMNGFAAARGADLKFHAVPGPEPVVGHYIVALSDSVAEDLAPSSAEALARAYVGQLEPARFSHARQFAIAMLPSRARTLSADPRVREVVEVARPDDDVEPTPSSSLARQYLTPASRDSSSSGTYLYDGAGNITAIGSDTFVYDLDGRLVDAVVKNNEQSYTYDVYGNRLSATRGQGAIACLGGTTCEAAVTMRETPSTTNHLANVTYDDAGNVLHGYDATYVYDGTGMVTQATVGSDIRNFAYTADDERIAVRRGSSWTWTVRDQGGKVLREFTSTETSSSPLTLTGHAWSKDYVWRDGLLLASISIPSGASSPATYHYHLDHLGSPRLITRDGGTVVSSHSYYPFGSEMNLPSQENPAEAMKFTGHERDIVVGSDHSVDYMHARLYNGNLGRFLAIDPDLDIEKVVHEPQTWNRYAYVTNNPLRYMDPNGQNRWDVANGFFNSFFSDFLLTRRYEQDNDDYKRGQRAGDQAGVTAGFVVATVSGTGGVVTSPTGVGALAGSAGMVYGLAAVANAGVHLAQDPNPRSRGEQLKTIIEEPAAVKKADGLTGKLKQGYEQIKELLASGQPGKNQHALTGDLKGWYAADLPGSGGGRGATRVIYKVDDNQVIIKDILNYHQ